MRLTIALKVILGLATLVSIGGASMLVVYRGLGALQRNVDELVDVEAPLVAAAHEMEINTLGLGLSVLKYLDTLTAADRARAQKDRVDFERFHARSLQLTRTAAADQLAAGLKHLHQRFATTGQAMMAEKDREADLFATIMSHVEQMDRILDSELQGRDPSGRRRTSTPLVASRKLERDIAEIGMWLSHDQQARSPGFLARIHSSELPFRQAMAELLSSPDLSSRQRGGARQVEQLFEEMMIATREVLAIGDRLQSERGRFVLLRTQIDDLLGDHIQPLAIAGLAVPVRRADAETASALRTARLLMALSLGAAVCIAFMLTRSVTAPVQRLMAGTDTIARGDLSYRIALTGTDELAELARRFNRMVAELQATTVSKDLLQVSESKLRETVGELRREIAEREHAQRERARLEAALRRSEVMSTMGSLVAGVAHEVRNPLFGISSTVDALEARLDRHGVTQYQQHLGVLRSELTRLTKLMQDLLEYGKPPALDLSWVAVDAMITEAVDGCRTRATQVGVRLVTRVDRLMPRLRVDRRRLTQVFQNLIDNALHYSPPGTQVCIEARRVDDGAGHEWIECAVMDSGPGFDALDLPRVFEPFVTRRRGGTGLGLSIVHRIVEAHGGDVAASNRAERGAVVMLSLPLGADSADTAGEQNGAENDPHC